jgi:DNA-binding protein HU-beta
MRRGQSRRGVDNWAGHDGVTPVVTHLPSGRPTRKRGSAERAGPDPTDLRVPRRWRPKVPDSALITDEFAEKHPRGGSVGHNGAMNKRELAKAVAVQADVDLKTVSNVLEGFTDVVTAVVSKGEPVAITGFAKFVKVDRPARMGRNPATGETIRIKASKKARITPVKAFKDAVMSPGGAPKLNRGVWPTSDEAVRGAGKSEAPVAARPVKTAARKAPAKKAAARRAPAKKAATRRPAAKKSAARRAPARRVVKKATARRR